MAFHTALLKAERLEKENAKLRELTERMAQMLHHFHEPPTIATHCMEDPCPDVRAALKD